MTVIPDPFHLDNWCSKQDTICSWPNVLYPDIFNYLTLVPAELGSKDLSSLCTDSTGLLYRRIVELNSNSFLRLQ